MPAFVLALLLSGTAAAQADPLPVEAVMDVGAPALRTLVRIESDDDGAVLRVRSARAGRAETVELPGASRGSIERLELAGGLAVALVSAEGAEARWAALISARRSGSQIVPVVLWVGRLDPHGDPGERVADVLERTDRTGDGAPDIVVGRRRERVGLCGRAPALLHPRALDPASGSLRPVVLRTSVGEAIGVTGTVTSELTGPPVLRSTFATGATSAVGVPEDEPALPFALTDGDLSTSWLEGRGGAGENEMAVLRVSSELPVRAIALVAPAAPARLPTTLTLVGDEGPALRVALPEASAGARIWVEPPSPRSWSCLAVVLAEPGGEAGALVGLAELELYTDLDVGGGVEGLVRSLVRDDPGADRSAELLVRLGAQGLIAVEAAWAELGERSRVRVAHALSRRLRPEGVPLLGTLARDASEEVRALALDALVRSGDRGLAEIAAVAGEPGDAGEQAAGRLVSLGAAPLEPLLVALAAEGGSERPRLRAAAAIAARQEPDARSRLDAWEAPSAAFASLALGLAAELSELSAVLADRALDREDELTFADRFRLLSAAAAWSMSPPPAIERWLSAVATDAEEWMLRELAVRAARSPEVWRSALADRAPRVRLAAIHRLASSEERGNRDALADRMERDPWPMVRAAAMTALAPHDPGAARRALDDDAQLVRERAIQTLTAARDRGALAAVRARLADSREWPIVTTAALEYVETLCAVEAAEGVLAVIRRGAREGAWAADVELARRALPIAIALGGDTERAARRLALAGGEALRALLEQPVRPLRCEGR